MNGELIALGVAVWLLGGTCFALWFGRNIRRQEERDRLNTAARLDLATRGKR